MLRLTARTSRTLLRAGSLARAFSTSFARWDAKIYEMPAMSPTMDEGGIVKWIVKEGQEFSADDELLEVETDKATMQVNALDDGVLAKILVPEGTNNVKVGSPIAFIAEPGDDLAAIKYPELPAAGAAAPPPAAAETPAPAAAASTPAPAKPTFTGGKPNPDQTFFPSVEFLLAENKISREDALAKITATGPNGKILRGDVLVFLGKINGDTNNALASYIAESEKLDLSHIELAEKTEPAAAAEAAPEGEAEAAASPPPKPVKQATTVSHQFVISSKVPAKVLSALVAKAASKAETAAYAAKNYTPSDLADPLFEDLIAPPANTVRFKVDYSINTTPAPVTDSIVDDFDFEPYEEKPTAKPDLLTTVDVELTCNDKAYDAVSKANVFVSKFENYLNQIDKKFA